MRFHKSLRKAALFLFAFVLLGFSTEAVLRFGLGLGNPVLVAPDSACDYIVKPDQRLYRFFKHTYINRFGMRSEEIPLERNPQSLRLMFVGDSIAYGTSRVDQSEIFTDLLRRDLPGIVHRPVEVLNAAANGWAIDNELSFVRSRGVFQSNAVVLVLNSGDLTQPRARLADIGDDARTKADATAIGELYSRGIAPRIFHKAGRVDAGDSSGSATDPVVQANLSDLETLRKLSLSQHAQLVVAYVPFRKDLLTASPAFAGILRDWTAAHGVPFLDLSSAEAPYAIDEICQDAGVHFNAKGNRIVAQAIERAWPTLVSPALPLRGN
jgi:hypothetical protein